MYYAIIVFLILLFLGMPVAFSIGISGLSFFLIRGLPLTVLVQKSISTSQSFTMLAIPFFILAGVVMEYAGISKRLVRLANAFIGHKKGGLAVVTVVASCFFAAISGSGPATVAALGGTLIPAMEDDKYDKKFATAVVAESGGIGMVIPPSIPFVIYAMITEVSIGGMFIAGIIPGLVLGAAFAITAILILRKDANIVVRPKASGKERWNALKDAFWGILSPIIILGGIYGGYFTPTEAAGVAVVYSLFVGMVIYKEIKIKDLPKIFKKACESSAVIMFIMGAAGAFSWILTTSGLAGILSRGLLSVSSNNAVLLLLITIIFLIAGCFVDSASGFYLLLPIIMPVVYTIGMNPYAFGVLATINFAIGLHTSDHYVPA